VSSLGRDDPIKRRDNRIVVDDPTFLNGLLALFDGGQELLLVRDVATQGFIDAPRLRAPRRRRQSG
jgi:hypothetical protein